MRRKAFVLSRARATRRFWSAFAETQSFCCFVDELSLSGDAQNATKTFSRRAFGECSEFVHSKKDVRAFARFLVLFPDLKRYRVPPPNEASLGADCEFDGHSAFVRLKDRYLIAPRTIDLKSAAHERGAGAAARHRGAQQVLSGIESLSKERMHRAWRSWCADSDAKRATRTRAHRFEGVFERRALYHWSESIVDGVVYDAQRAQQRRAQMMRDIERRLKHLLAQKLQFRRMCRA